MFAAAATIAASLGLFVPTATAPPEESENVNLEKEFDPIDPVGEANYFGTLSIEQQMALFTPINTEEDLLDGFCVISHENLETAKNLFEKTCTVAYGGYVVVKVGGRLVFRLINAGSEVARAIHNQLPDPNPSYEDDRFKDQRKKIKDLKQKFDALSKEKKIDEHLIEALLEDLKKPCESAFNAYFFELSNGKTVIECKFEALIKKLEDLCN